MPSLPLQFLNSLKHLPLPDEEGFKRVHSSGEQITSIRCNPFKLFSPEFELKETVPWSSMGHYLENRPSFTHDPSFHAGCYYVQEAGSMFLEYALCQTIDFTESLSILDLCAAPGGKSTILNSLMSDDSLLVSNELIHNRASTLAYNLSKWGRANTIATNNTPEQFERLPGFFDLLVVDAPCSGSGLFRKQEEAMDEWSPEHVNACSLRQKNILGSALKCLKEGGLLFYSTCSYSKEENEDIVDWMVQEMGMEVHTLKVDPNWGIVQNAKGFRFYPHLLRSEGFFCCLLVKRDPGNEKNQRVHLKNTLTEKERTVLEMQVKIGDMDLLKKNEKYYLLNRACHAFLNLPVPGFYFRKAGVCLGELKNMTLVPDHEFALSLFVSDTLPRIELDKARALTYLKKENFSVDEKHKGWVCFTHQKNGLGWGKLVANRINNYLPSNLRILK
ncbi:MAG: RNA methyltransferase [Bacteroidia bacterium]|jgi:16S rRNA C967 or C1407 C5-methylase (RsmB/RsmF family)/NOL1/NOP2/fmu family ribosome biogenesis protein|nr:RNA methyltransferase [Bacteroidia bacterium]